MKPSSYPPNQIWTVLSVVFWALMPIPIQGAEFIVLDEVLGQRTDVQAVSGDGSTVVGGYWQPGTTDQEQWSGPVTKGSWGFQETYREEKM